MSLRLVLPARCLLCEAVAATEVSLCRSCATSFAKALQPRSLPPQVLAGRAAFAAARYEGAFRAFLRLAKAQSSAELPKAFARPLREIAEHWAEELRRFGIHAVVPLPSHPWRVLTQTDLAAQLASEMSRSLGVPCAWGSLRRSPFRAPQKFLRGHERRAKLGLRLGSTQGLRGQRLLLVDDVSTTGASLAQATEVLEAHGLRVQASWVLARRGV